MTLFNILMKTALLSSIVAVPPLTHSQNKTWLINWLKTDACKIVAGCHCMCLGCTPNAFCTIW